MTQTRFNVRINSVASSPSVLDTASLFDKHHIELNNSPIDNCINKLQILNLINVQYIGLATSNQNSNNNHYNLILLGYISAVESYLREIIRKLILIDNDCRITCENQQLSYGSAINYDKEMMPEAILEKVSFASKKNIVDSILKFLNINNANTSELTFVLNEFERICHLRHCVVHRFGKLGGSNAINLGLDVHSNLLEKPLSLNQTQLLSIYQVCENTILVINDFLFKRILERCADSNTFSWDYRKDKKKFDVYFNLFYSNSKPASQPINAKNCYKQLRKYKLNIR